MILTEENYLEHYGILRKSGRYPWGSGNTQSARNQSFLETVKELEGKGMTKAEIAKGFGLTTTQLNAARSIAVNQQRQEKINQAQRLKDKAYSNVAIAQRMGVGESTVRSWLAPGAKDRADILQNTASMLRRDVDTVQYLDVGVGVERHMGVSQERLKTAVALLKEEGYKIHYVKIPQAGTGDMTTLKVLTKGNVPYSEVYRNRGDIRMGTQISKDGGRTSQGIHPPISVNSRRLKIRYAEDGGGEADGVVFVRPGVKDLSLGEKRYAQVRIAVDGTHYIKGMAMYKDDLPEGTDLVFNTSKKNTGRKQDALKEMEKDPDNPFGSWIKRQITEVDSNGNERVTSVMNIVNEEGDWSNWSKSLASQMLSKQDPKLVKNQLDMMYESKHDDLDEIMRVTNPVIKRKLLETFSDSADSSAAHLEAAAMPRQAFHAILPIGSMKRDEIYAPNYRNGEQVVLIRYPHGGTFEIPELKVNNRQREARRMIGVTAVDAVGIHPKVAERLSGADFDGDTVLVIPNNKRLIKWTPALEGLKGFDPRSSFPPYEGMRTIDGGHWNSKTQKADFPEGAHPKTSNKQKEMGTITNLITDMTIKGANTEELARAIRHSMVVIDSEKHSLDFKSSERANGILQLKKLYQQGGASTLLSRAGSPAYIQKRKPRRASLGGPIDPATGRKVYEETGESYVNRRGQTVFNKQKVKRLSVTEDAFDLSSHPITQIESLYATHSNRMKALANQARKESLTVGKIKKSDSASRIYSHEVDSLRAKLDLALRNAPLERRAQILTDAVVRLKRQANPDFTEEDLKKIKFQTLTEMRTRTDARKDQIRLTPREWEAIQAGAISTNRLTQIIDNSDLDYLRRLAMPREAPKMTSVKQLRAQSMLASGYTQSEVADALGVSLSTLKASIASGDVQH